MDVSESKKGYPKNLSFFKNSASAYLLNMIAKIYGIKYQVFSFFKSFNLRIFIENKYCFLSIVIL